tara:strand:- start:11792 stop:12526 length:735 start_codon:yes stop_codon:yes gene_type:complete
VFKEIEVRNITLIDNKNAMGILLTNENKDLIICVHGLASSSNNYVNLKIRDYVIDNNLNYDVFRFDFYNSNNNTRSFQETTIETQVQDLENIIKNFSPKYDNIYLLATSYGALTSVALNSKLITKQILVDPSFVINLQWKCANIKITEDNLYINNSLNIPSLLNPEMYKEGLAWTAKKSQELINNISSPTLIIQANSFYYKMSAKLDYSNTKIITHYIESADHNFINMNSCNIMLQKAFSFIKI